MNLSTTIHTPANSSWAESEFAIREAEIARCQNYSDYCAMKKRWRQRAREAGFSRKDCRDLMREYLGFLRIDG